MVIRVQKKAPMTEVMRALNDGAQMVSRANLRLLRVGFDSLALHHFLSCSTNRAMSKTEISYIIGSVNLSPPQEPKD